MTAAELVAQHWQCANARDWAGFEQLLARDLVYEVPQTRERVRGSGDYVEFFRTWPGDWQAEVVQLVADVRQVVTVIRFVIGETVETGITLFEIEAGLIQRVTDYWPAPYEPPPRMTDRIERY